MRYGEQPTEDRVSIVLGGPFHSMLKKFGLVGNDQLPAVKASVALVSLAWLPPALLVIGQTLAHKNFYGWGFFTDWTVYTRYLIAIWAMIATERHADSRVAMLIRHIREAQLLQKDSLSRFSAALSLADRRSSSPLTEAIILVIAVGWSSITANHMIEITVSKWSGILVLGEPTLSWAGEFTRYVSTPLFLFLVFRWLWRFGVWGILLFTISRLKLQLTALHPDRAAGLGFLAIFPSIFGGYIFALSCVVAAAAVTELSHVHHDPQQVWFLVAGWILTNLLVFIGPLFVFAVPLYRVREEAVLEYGRLASHHHLAFSRKWIDGKMKGKDLIGSPDPSSVSDLNASVEVVQNMRFIPVDRNAIIQVVLASGAPMLAVIATQLPMSDLLKWLLAIVA